MYLKKGNYILDFLSNRPTDSTFLEVLSIAKTFLKQHIVCEVTELMGQYDEMLELIGEPVKLVLATADAFAKFSARSSSGGASSNTATSIVFLRKSREAPPEKDRAPNLAKRRLPWPRRASRARLEVQASHRVGPSTR